MSTVLTFRSCDISFVLLFREKKKEKEREELWKRLEKLEMEKNAENGS